MADMFDTTETLPIDAPDDTGEPEDREVSEAESAQVAKIQATIRADKKFHRYAFRQMRDDMFMARTGRNRAWSKSKYKANLAGRHVKQKVAALYAKNPKAVARRRETLDFAVWDESPESLKMAFQTIQMAQQQLAAAPMQQDPVTGVSVTPDPAPEQMQAFQTAMQTVQDYQQGMARREQIERIGKTLEVLFSQAMRDQKPVDFKTGMKQCVRRATTTGVGYVEVGFQRETGPRPGLTEQLSDARQRLDHLQRLAEEAQEGEIEADTAEMYELEKAIAALQAEPEIVLREGLLFDFPQATRVIPDKLCRQLTGFVGARHLTIEYLFTKDQVEELFDVDLGENFVGYTLGGKSSDDGAPERDADGNDEVSSLRKAGIGNGMVCVWKHYEKSSGLVYYVADGCNYFLREAAAPDVFVDDFWPVAALTFNEVENEDELFPPSDVFLMSDMQMEYNRSRQGMRDHRWAARPRWVYGIGTIEEKDVDSFKTQEPFEMKGIALPQGSKIGDILQGMPVPGVDPNLYGTEQFFTDIQLAVGSSEAQFGGTAKATATESAIAAGSSKSADDASVDELDAFLTVIARMSGQILMKEMSEEQVQKIAGVGALWPPMSLSDIAAELTLEIEAGSSGKPNQAIETNNFKELAPILLQTPGIDPVWMATEAVKRLDDRADLTKALSQSVPSMVAMNAMQQPKPGDPQADPNAQGPQGANKGPPPPPSNPQGGSSAAFGSNQT